MPTPATAHHQVRDTLYEAFRLRAHPIVIGADFGVPAATLWTSARTWVKKFREAGVKPGDRVVLRCARTPAHIMATIAAWWEGITLCPVAPKVPDTQESLLNAFDAAIIIDSEPGLHAMVPQPAGDAPDEVPQKRKTGPASDDIALIMTTSGSSGTPTRVALSYANILHHLTAHTGAIDLSESDVVYSVLPWNHAFGMLVDLWPALLSGAMIIVDPLDGKSPESILDAIHEHEVTSLSMVPIQASAIAERTGGIQALASLRFGIVGGAPLSPSLAQTLAVTRLRPGYGQTEASPGITLGTPGVFFEGALGSPLGCETRIADGELLIRGVNVCAGFWRNGALVREDPDRWLATGDLVEQRPDGLRFLGRRDHRFKLDNGRMINTPALERAIEVAVPIGEAVLFPVDGTALHTVLVCRGPLAQPDEDLQATVAAAMQKEGRLLAGVSLIADSPAFRTRKGEIDRHELFKAASARTPISRLAA